MKRPEGDMDQDLLSGTEGDMCRRSRDRMRLSKSSISESVRFRRKLKFQEKGREYPRIDDPFFSFFSPSLFVVRVDRSPRVIDHFVPLCLKLCALW